MAYCLNCKTHLSRRYCLRNNVRLCWKCCNKLRVDLKCPPTCEYRAQEAVKISPNQIKTDCLEEYYDFIDLHTQRWITRPSPLFANQIPRFVAESVAGKDELQKKLLRLKLDRKIAESYEKHLAIDLQAKLIPYPISFEDVGRDFLKNIAEHNWNAIPSYFEQKNNKTVSTILKRLKMCRTLQKLDCFLALASGLSPDGKTAFSTFEMNHQWALTLLLAFAQNEWMLENIIFGEAALIGKENESLKHIAFALSKKEYDQALKMIEQAENIYYLSPDVQYYKGLYYSINKNPYYALRAFEEATDLDLTFAEAFYNQAFIHHADHELEKAKTLYRKTIALQPQNVQALNNLGTIYLDEKDYQQARTLFQKALDLDPNFLFARENLEMIKEK